MGKRDKGRRQLVILLFTLSPLPLLPFIFIPHPLTLSSCAEPKVPMNSFFLLPSFVLRSGHIFRKIVYVQGGVGG